MQRCHAFTARLSLPMQGTDASRCTALFAPENTKHTGAISAPAVGERCSSMDGLQRRDQRPVAR